MPLIPIIGISLWWLIGAIGAVGITIIGWFPIKNKLKKKNDETVIKK